MPKYRVWEPDITDETELIVENGKWAEYDALCPEDAAQDLAQAMADSGDYPDHMEDEYEILVRDLETSTLYAITIFYEWEPLATVGKAKEVPVEEDRFVIEVAESYGMRRDTIIQ